jgi:hypothetical protein
MSSTAPFRRARLPAARAPHPDSLVPPACAACRLDAAEREVNLAAVIQTSLLQLFGVIGGAVPLEFEEVASSSGKEGVVTVDKR